MAGYLAVSGAAMYAGHQLADDESTGGFYPIGSIGFPKHAVLPLLGTIAAGAAIVRFGPATWTEPAIFATAGAGLLSTHVAFGYDMKASSNRH